MILFLVSHRNHKGRDGNNINGKLSSGNSSGIYFLLKTYYHVRIDEGMSNDRLVRFGVTKRLHDLGERGTWS